MIRRLLRRRAAQCSYLALALVVPLAPSPANAAGTERIIVAREPGLTASERSAVRALAGARLVRRLAVRDTELVEVPSGRRAEALARLDGASRSALRRAGSPRPRGRRRGSLPPALRPSADRGSGRLVARNGQRRDGRGRRQRHRVRSPGPGRPHRRQSRRARERHRRRWQRGHGRPSRVGLRRRRQRAGRSQRARHPRRGDRRSRAERHRRHRRGSGRQGAPPEGARRRRRRLHLGCGGRIRLRRANGRAGRQRVARRPWREPDARHGLRGSPRDAVRDRGGQRRHGQRPRADLPVQLAGAQRALRRGERRARRTCAVLQRRRDHRGRLRARRGHRVDDRRLLRGGERHVSSRLPTSPASPPWSSPADREPRRSRSRTPCSRAPTRSRRSAGSR